VQRTGAGREKAGEPVDPHAGIVFHARRGDRVQKGRPLATLYATTAEQLAESTALLTAAIRISSAPPPAVDLIQQVITREIAEASLADADKVKRNRE
jgi:thymidine phosphorylase